MIRKANLHDIKDIMYIIEGTLKEMHSYKNYQWNKNYPKEKDFINDIEKGNLYVKQIEQNIVGFMCINKEEAIEYKDLTWSLQKEAMVIHRMAVNINYRKKGIGTSLMNFAEEVALSKKIPYIKTDTNSLNTKMKNLFIKFGYKYIGQVRFEGTETPFECYDKIIM